MVSFFACKKGDTGPEGPAGPAGPTGPQGPQGVAGNANVTQYSFGAQNFPTIGFAQLQVTTSKDTMERSQWFVYLYYAPIDRWYTVPGYGTGGTTAYRISMGHASGKVNIYIDKIGTGENYAAARVIRVYANTVLAGGRMAALPNIDFSDYEAVRLYYHLPK